MDTMARRTAWGTVGWVVIAFAAGAVQLPAWAGDGDPSSGVQSTAQVESAPLGKPQKPVTLVGRGNKVRVIEKDGTVEDLSAEKLTVPNRSKAPVPKIKSQSEAVKKERVPSGEAGTSPDTEQGKAPPEAGKASDKTPPEPPGRRSKAKQAQGAEPAEKPAATAEEKQRAEAVKKADIERLRKLQWEGGWFYDAKGKPVSSEELDKRIEAGDLAGVKTVDVHLNEWKTESKPSPSEPAK